jgi:hypothetical protein
MFLPTNTPPRQWARTQEDGFDAAADESPAAIAADAGGADATSAPDKACTPPVALPLHGVKSACNDQAIDNLGVRS